MKELLLEEKYPKKIFYIKITIMARTEIIFFERN